MTVSRGIVLAVLVSSGTLTMAVGRAQAACSDSVVYFVNGVGNTIAQAETSRLALAEKLAVSFDGGCFPVVRLAYVTSEGAVFDVPEAIRQLNRQVRDDDADHVRHLRQFRAASGPFERIVLVAHSQGNLYANRAWEVLASEGLGSRITVVSVATPDSYVAGNGLHITLEEDGIHTVVDSALSANMTNGRSCFFAVLGCHGFVLHYLDGAVSQQAIMRVIGNALAATVPPFLQQVEVFDSSRDTLRLSCASNFFQSGRSIRDTGFGFSLYGIVFSGHLWNTGAYNGEFTWSTHSWEHLRDACVTSGFGLVPGLVSYYAGYLADGDYHIRWNWFDAIESHYIAYTPFVVERGEIVSTTARQRATFSFTGTARGFGLDGARCSGSYTFDPRVADTHPDPNIGVYRMSAQFGFEVNIGGQRIIGPTAGLTIRVRNNIGGVEDDYEVTPDQPSGSDLHLIVRTRDLGAFAGDALPTTTPWGGGWWGVFEGDHAGRSYVCDIDSLTRAR